MYTHMNRSICKRKGQWLPGDRFTSISFLFSEGSEVPLSRKIIQEVHGKFVRIKRIPTHSQDEITGEVHYIHYGRGLLPVAISERHLLRINASLDTKKTYIYLYTYNITAHTKQSTLLHNYVYTNIHMSRAHANRAPPPALPTHHHPHTPTPLQKSHILEALVALITFSQRHLTSPVQVWVC